MVRVDLRPEEGIPLYPGVTQLGNLAVAEESGAVLAVAPDNWLDGCPVLETQIDERAATGPLVGVSAAAVFALLVTAVAGWRRAEAGFRADRPGAESLLKVGESAVDPDLDVIQCAAYTTVASTLLNLDEAVTKE